MAALDAWSTLILVVVVPSLVWILGHTGWTGDRKRLIVLAMSAVVAAVQAVLTGIVGLPSGWLPIVERALIAGAGFVVLTQSIYTMLWAKLPDSNYEAKRAES